MELSARDRPVLVFDGDCAFCTNCANFLKRIGPNAEIVPWQFADLADLGVTAEQATEAVQWVETDGAVRSGHEAIAAVFSRAGAVWRVVGRLMTLPGISWLTGWGYRLVARNRYRLPGGTPACRVDGA
jgi:predicted DCC family thiol-disulfide oxidoreductase YuxK